MTRRRKLSPEEEALWRKATRDVATYRAKRPAVEKLVSGPQGLSEQRAKLRTPTAHAPLPPSPLVSRPHAHPFVAGDPGMDKLASRGRLPIDAVLDLHGHRQTTARAVLHGFIAQGYQRGARCLLVITGKGAPGKAGAAGQGVLRASFQDWLTEEPVRRLISRASPAHQRHGGGGAFYVFLKR